MQNIGASLKTYHFTKFCVAVLIPTENMCFSRCKRWLKTSEMHEANYLDKRSFKLCFLHNCTALISVTAVLALSYEVEVDTLVLNS